MGYSTNYTGELKFAHEPSVAQIRDLSKFFGEDCRDHPEWGARGNVYYIDLELSDDMDGVKWNGSEKSSPMDEQINIILRNMRKTFPEFGFTGQMLAQGESIEDRWVCAIGDDGLAYKAEIAITGQRVTCPHCDRKFILEAASE